MRTVPINSWPRDLELVNELFIGRYLVLHQRRAVARIRQLDAMPMNPGIVPRQVFEMDDHGVAHFQLELRAGNRPVVCQHTRHHAAANVNDCSLRHDGRFDDVGVGVHVHDLVHLVRIRA